jgi:hypothetical protein
MDFSTMGKLNFVIVKSELIINYRNIDSLNRDILRIILV